MAHLDSFLTSFPVRASTGPGGCFNVPDESKKHIKYGLMGPQP